MWLYQNRNYFWSYETDSFITPLNRSSSISQLPNKVNRPECEMSWFSSLMLGKYAGEAAARIRVDGGVSVSCSVDTKEWNHRIRKYSKSCCGRDMTHYSQAHNGVEALVLSLLRFLSLSVNLKHPFLSLSLSLSHTYLCNVTHSHACTFLAWEKWAIHVSSQKTAFIHVYFIPSYPKLHCC